MNKLSLVVTLIIVFIATLTACQPRSANLGQQEALNIAWKNLEPNTSSHNRDYWEIHDARKVYGKDIVKEFTSTHPARCQGPEFPENMPIKISSEYWYIKVAPHPEVRVKVLETSQPKYVQVVPEPNILDATFLIDMYDGEVIAQTMTCR